MSTRYSDWVLLNYPVVNSRSCDNAGGYDHLIGNIQVYRLLGYKVVCICRWSPRIIDTIEGALILNIVPGAAIPALKSLSFSPKARLAEQEQEQAQAQAQEHYRLNLSSLPQAVRSIAMSLLGTGLQILLRPRLLHQRANLRFMLKPRNKGEIHLIELNDDYVPVEPCNAYLTVVTRSKLQSPQFVWRWPVPEVAQFNVQRFIKCLNVIAKPTRPLKVLMFGIGGTNATQNIYGFIASHPWFKGKDFELHIFGSTKAAPAVGGIVQHGWCDPALLNGQDYDVSILYYDSQVYDDGRLRLGSPTKLWKYIDWSLPVFCNRTYVSEHFLGSFDNSSAVLHKKDCALQYAEYLQEIRRHTLPATYANGLVNFLTDKSPIHDTIYTSPMSSGKAQKPSSHLP